MKGFYGQPILAYSSTEMWTSVTETWTDSTASHTVFISQNILLYLQSITFSLIHSCNRKINIMAHIMIQITRFITSKFFSLNPCLSISSYFINGNPPLALKLLLKPQMRPPCELNLSLQCFNV